MYEIYNTKGIYVCCTDDENEAIKYIVENGGYITMTKEEIWGRRKVNEN